MYQETYTDERSLVHWEIYKKSEIGILRTATFSKRSLPTQPKWWDEKSIINLPTLKRHHKLLKKEYILMYCSKCLQNQSPFVKHKNDT